MECSRVKVLLYGYVCEALSEKLHQEVREHLQSGCPSCTQKWQEVQQRLGRFADVSELPSPSLSVEAILKAAHRRAIWLRSGAIGIVLLMFAATLYLGLLVARYRYERILLAELEKAIFVYRLEQGKYPPAGANLLQTLQEISSVRPYLKLWQSRTNSYGELVDFWGSPIRYAHPGVHNPGLFDIYSCGRNKRDDSGTKDDIRNWLPPS